MPPRKEKAAERLAVETQAYINPHTRDSEFEVFLREGCNKIVSISPTYGLGPRHRLGYQRVQWDEIELLEGDQMYPLEKDFGMYWVEQDAEGWAVIKSSTGEEHFILAMDKSVRDRKMEAQRRMMETKNDNLTDQQHARTLSQGLKRGSEYEAEVEEHEETIQL